MPKRKRTVGVLGGMGPHATLDFLQLLLKLTPVTSEQEHVPVIVSSNPNMPSRTRAYLFNEDSPVVYLQQGIESLLAANAEVIVVPCNSAHYFLPEIKDALDFPFIDMVQATANHVKSLGYKKVGLLAGEVTVGAQLYEQAFGTDATMVQVNQQEQTTVRSIIEAVKLDEITAETISLYWSLLKTLRDKGCDIVILGCTELQAVSQQEQDIIPIIDSLEVLAKAVIRFSQNENSEIAAFESASSEQKSSE